MTLSALQHIIRAAQALAEDRGILVLGSASLLGLLAYLHAAGLMDAGVVRSRMDLLDIPVERVPRLHSNFRDVFRA